VPKTFGRLSNLPHGTEEPDFHRLPCSAWDTLAFSARAGVRSMNEAYPLDRISEAYDRMMSGKARFRVVLTIRS